MTNRSLLLAAVLLMSTAAFAQRDPSAEPTGGLTQPTQRDPSAEPTGTLQPVSPTATWQEKIEVFGYVKAGYFWVLAGDGDALVGARNGFRLLNARLGLAIKPIDPFEVIISFDGAVGRRNDTDALNGNRVVELRDGYGEWSASRFVRLRVGQFKAPFNVETLLGDAELPFINRSIISDGVLPPEGFRQEGLSLDRQVGVQVASERLGTESIGFRYAVAVVNGNGPNVLNNDNRAVTPVGRMVFTFRNLFSAGANAFYDVQTEGVRPNRISSNRLGLGGDLALHLAGFDLLTSVISRSTRYSTTQLPAESALGWMASLRYFHQTTGLEGGVRYASLEPSNVDPDDELTELSAMIGYRSRKMPFRAVLQYTMRGEARGVAIANDSVDVMGQVSW